MSGDSNRIFWSVLLVSMILLAAAPPASADEVTFFFEPTAGADGTQGKFWVTLSGVEPSNPNAFVNIESSLECKITQGATQAECTPFGAGSPTSMFWDDILVGNQFTALQTAQAFTEIVTQASPFGPSTFRQRWVFNFGGTIPTVFQEMVSVLVHVNVGKETTDFPLEADLIPLPRSQAEFDAALSEADQQQRKEFREQVGAVELGQQADEFFTFSMSGTSWSAFNSSALVSVVNRSAPSDSIPPTTTATLSPGPVEGWNKTNVRVTLNATDNPGGSGVQDIQFRLTGAGAEVGTGVVRGGTASVTISAEGSTTLTYFARDNAGNQEDQKTVMVKIDKTAPTITGLPAAGCTLWPPNHRLVQVATVRASDTLSGLAGALSLAGHSTVDGLGDGDTGPDIVISGGAVQLRAERSGTGTGRIYTMTAWATDVAGNTASASATCTVPHDQRK